MHSVKCGILHGVLHDIVIVWILFILGQASHQLRSHGLLSATYSFYMCYQTLLYSPYVQMRSLGLYLKGTAAGWERKGWQTLTVSEILVFPKGLIKAECVLMTCVYNACIYIYIYVYACKHSVYTCKTNTYIHTYLPTYIPTYIHTYVHTYIDYITLHYITFIHT
jgi:hypothetical protein